MQKIADKAPKAKLYFSDANPSDKGVSYFRENFSFFDKSHTFIVEEVNSILESTLLLYNVGQNVFLDAWILLNPSWIFLFLPITNLVGLNFDFLI